MQKAKRLAVRIIVLCIAVLLASAAPVYAVAGKDSPKVQANPVASPDTALAFLSADFHMLNGFESHLPLIILGQDETVGFYPDGAPPASAVLEDSPKLHGRYTEQWSEPAGRGRPAREKKDYSLVIDSASLTELQAVFWGEAVQNEWYLLGDMYDKSLMRNYLALSLANELDISAYRVQYCEVFAAAETGLEYRGIYLLAAPIDTGYTYVQRGNYWDADSVPLDTYASRQDILLEGLYVSAADALDAAELAEMEATLDAMEKSVYSSDYNSFSKYSSYLDLEKMYDYFILYELFGNYSGAHLSRYMYDAQEKKFWPVALADFQFSVDNEQNAPLDIFGIEMETTPYYGPLVKSTTFVNGLVGRYQFLVQDLLKGSNLFFRVEQAASYLGEGRLRDWARWQSAYNSADMYLLASAESNPTDSSLPPLNRNTYSYEQEITKLEITLAEHGQYLFGGLSDLYRQENMVGTDATYVRNTWMYLIFILLVIASVVFVRYRTRSS